MPENRIIGDEAAKDGFAASVHAATDAHSIIAITDADGVITDVNENFIAMSGYSREELVGKTHKLINSDYHPPEFFEKMWAKIKAGDLWRGIIRNRAKNGDLYWVDTTITPIRDNTGKVSGFTSVRTNVSEMVMRHEVRKQEAENAVCLKSLYEMACGTERIEDILDKALALLLDVSWLRFEQKGGIFLADEETGLLRLKAAHKLGALQEKCAKVKPGQCLCGRAALEKKTQHAACIDERHETAAPDMKPHGHYNVPIMYGKDVLGVIVVYLPDGTARSDDHVNFLESFAKTLALIIRLRRKQVLLHDALGQAERYAKEAQAASKEALQAAEAKGNFLATMSHEIRTPMNSVVGMLYLLGETELTEEQSEYAQIARSSADALLNIIDDILDFSRYEQGTFTLNESAYKLPDLIEQALEPFYAPAQDKGVDLRFEGDAALPDMIMGDAGRLRQIISNLVSNALKFTPKGRILVKAERKGGSDNPRLILMVADTGIGIAPDVREVIFERFSQADGSITREFGGTGLGLAICKTLSEAMGGRIGVDSEEGKGSTFWIDIPLTLAKTEEQNAEADDRGADDIEDMPPLPLKILVAEDNPHNQFLIRKLLEANDHDVTCVADGLQAAERAAAELFDLIFMDMQMPVLDGVGATQEIRKLDGAYGKVPIYAVSANALSEHHAQSAAAGMDGHINKPIRPAELYDVLAQITAMKESECAPVLAKAS